MDLAEYRTSHPAKAPAFVITVEDQCKLMTIAEGRRAVTGFGPSEASPSVVSEVPTTIEAAGLGRHLWVIAPDEVPYGPESCPFAEKLVDGVLKHSNLTGGAPAHFGGEIWFLEAGTVIVNGSSGRYGPATPAQLKDAAEALASCGYKVGLVPWNTDLGRPHVTVTSEEELEWF